MMTMSKPKTAGGAQGYFRKEYEHERGSYYTQNKQVVGVWNGELAAEFGLTENVSEEQFTRLANGQHPDTGEQLIRQVKAHERTNKFGDIRKTLGHRAGVDITNSAPKSVTLAGIVGGDERIFESHREANLAAMREVEHHIQARLGGNKEPETTGKAIIATFEHDAARPDRKTHYAAPDLHSHNFVFNLAKTVDGKIKSVDMAELYRCQKLGTAAYRAKLAEGLQRLGYEVRVDERTGAPEIEGISREYIEASSPRQTEIKETAERMRADGKQKGMMRADGSTSTRAAATQKRRSKVFDRDEMKERHQDLEAQHGGQAHNTVQAARMRAQVLDAELLHDADESRASAQESVTYAVTRLSEREAVNKADALLTHALERGLGEATLEDVKAEIKRRHERGDLIGIAEADAARRQMTTEKMLATERANIEITRAGQVTQQPFSKSLPKQVVTPQGVALNESQRAAVEQIVTNRDRVQGLQGGAGTGKTTALSAVKAEAERAGYDVCGFAPTTRATQTLAESGIESKTLQKFIREKQNPDAGRRLLVLDESSLASTKQVNAFLSKANPQDRILLVGDVRQHEAVEAGSPFAQLQAHGMQTARLEKIVRQKEEPLRRVVEKLAVGEVKSAVDDLNAQGRVTEIADGKERLQTIARDYIEKPEGTLVISPRNSEREELNRLIHDERRRSEQLNQKEYATRILRNRNELTGAERTFAGAYRYEDIIRFNTNSKIFDVRAGEYARVDAVNRKANLITVEFAAEGKGNSPRRMTYDPKRLQGVSVYEEAEIKISEGERIQFRAPAQKQRISNGELGTLEKIEKDKLTVKLDSGRRVSFPASENPHLDYGYAVTSHSSQGQTVDRVLVNMDTHEPDVLLNQRMAYVAASRTRTDVKIYTDSASRLGSALARQVNKSTALEATQKLPHITPSAKETSDEQTRRTASTERENRPQRSSDAGAIAASAERTLSAFDRSRIRQPAARAARDAGRNAGIAERSRDAANRVEEAANQDRTSEPQDRRDGESRHRNGRTLDGSGRESRNELRRTEAGHAQHSDSDGTRAVSNQIRVEQANIAASGGRDREERYTAPDSQATRSTNTEPTTATSSAGDRVRAVDGLGDSTSHQRSGTAGMQNNPLPGATVPEFLRLRADKSSTTEQEEIKDKIQGIQHSSGLDKSSPPDSTTARVQRTNVETLDATTQPDVAAPSRIADEVRFIFDRSAQIQSAADELIHLANENRLAQGQPAIDQQVQDFMRSNLIKSAERSPSEQQIERDQQLAQQLGHSEPQHENALQSSLYAAQHAPNRDELLSDFTTKTETAFAKQQQALTREPEQSTEFSAPYQSRNDYSIDR